VGLFTIIVLAVVVVSWLRAMSDEETPEAEVSILETRLPQTTDTMSRYRGPFPPGGRSDLSVASVSASSGRLSVRQVRIRGKRTAIPDLCRAEGAMASKARGR
jgi:hypothetical protein